MISPDLVQVGIIAHLKANAALIAWLTSFSAGSEVRENQWQGRQFVYPAIRVDLLGQNEPGNPPCFSDISFNIYAFAEGDSSLQAAQLAGLVDTTLLRKKFSGTGFTSGLVTTLGSVPPIRTGERVWQALLQYQTNLYGGDYDSPQA